MFGMSCLAGFLSLFFYLVVGKLGVRIIVGR